MQQNIKILRKMYDQRLNQYVK